MEVAKYATVGVLQNLAGYLVYLLITAAGMDPKLAVTVLYPVGLAVSYIGNKKWTFTHEGGHTSAVFRFGLTHLVGYLINIMLLYIFVDRLGYGHQLVQLAAMAVLMCYFFLALKLFVFSSGRAEQADG